MDKYKLTTNEKVVNGVKVFQIRALKQLPIYGILTGDLGGWVDSKSLSHEGNCWLMPNATLIDSTVTGDTLVTEGVIENSTLLANKIACKTIKDSVIEGELTVVDGGSSLFTTLIQTKELVEISEGSELHDCHLFGKDIRIWGTSVLKNTVIRANDVLINLKSTISSTRLEGESLYLFGCKLSESCEIDGNEVVLRDSEVKDFKIKGEGIVLHHVNLVKGRLIAKRMETEGELDVYNSHIEVEDVKWDGTLKLHNCSLRGVNLGLHGDVNTDWVYLHGDDIKVAGIIELKGRELTEDFMIRGKTWLNGIISMKVEKNPITLNGETLEGDFVFSS